MKKEKRQLRSNARAGNIMELFIPFLFVLCGSFLFLGCSQDAPQVRWKQVVSGTDAHLYGVHFVDAKRGWAVGTEGIVLSTTNGGVTWKSQTLPPQFAKNALTQINFTTPKNGWILSIGTVLYTGSGGKSWLPQNPNIKHGLLGLHFVSRTEGWAVGGRGTILHTQNGGTRWKKQKNHSERHLWGVHFVDNLNGWIVGEKGEVLHTRDGGKDWARQQSNVEQPLFAVHFAGLRKGWIVGGNGLILQTENGGRTWQRQQNPEKNNLRDVAFHDENEGWAVGEDGLILHTIDGGNTWNRYATPAQSNLQDIYLLKNSGWIVGAKGTILRSD